MSLLELLASGYAPRKPWYACEKCKCEFQGLKMAWSCYKSHFRSYERVYADLKSEEKTEVVFVNNNPLCGGCAAKIKDDAPLCTVRMANPPACSRCNGAIVDKPLPEVKPNRLPLSERHHDLILHPSRDAEEAVMRLAWHRNVRRAGLNSIGTHGPLAQAGNEINAKLFKEFGSYQPDGNGGILRTGSGYLEVDQKEMVEVCLPKSQPSVGAV